MPEKLTIWCNAEFPDAVTADLVDATREYRLLIDDERAANIHAGGKSPLLAQADVAFGQPDPGQVIELASLKWTHLTSAGYTRYDNPEVKQALNSRNAFLTNSSSVFNEPCAQHLMAFMLAQARQLPQSMIDQLGSRSWAFKELRPQTRLLANEGVLILGLGAIARRLIELLAPFHLNLVAVRQTVRGDEPVETHSISELHRLLPFADHVVNILPASASTDRMIGPSEFERMKPGAVFYNIGRGTTVDQAALIAALNSHKLSAAYLDVADPEPLPRDHPLWSASNCWITPHIGGGHAEEFPRLLSHFLENLKRFESGMPLVDRVF